MTADRDGYENDAEAWDDDDADDGYDSNDDDEPTEPCPYCRREILEDVPQCPYCERYISAEDHARPSKPLWVIVTALVCLGIAIWLAFAAF
jgi:hypothetical protein